MKVVIWDGCMVVEELTFDEATGPDIHLDPWALPDSIVVWRDGTPTKVELPS